MARNDPGAAGASCSLQYSGPAAAAIRVPPRSPALYAQWRSVDEQRRPSGEAVPAAQGEQARVARITVMGQFAASIAHELNQPLAAIVLNAAAALKWLDHDPPQLDQARAALSAILGAGTSAGDVIRSMNDMARKSAPELSTFPLDDAIAEVLLLLRSELHKQGIQVRIDCPPERRKLHADRAQVKQVMMNLFVNAIHAMGAVSGRPRVLEVRSESGDASGALLISVADTGCGLAAGAAERLFDPLFSTRPSGMGMGLSICRSIVEAHGGRISCRARQPHGAVFQLSLPAAPHAAPKRANASATPAP